MSTPPARAVPPCFPLDIASRASNLAERAHLVAGLNRRQFAAPLSKLDQWKISKFAGRLSAQYVKQSLRTTSPPKASQDEIASVLERFRVWELHLGHADEASTELLAGLHQPWLPTYRAALEAFDPADGGELSDVARVCEPFLQHLRRELGAAIEAANLAVGTELFDPGLAGDFTGHFLGRFELALAWAAETDLKVWSARFRIGDVGVPQHLRYLRDTFADAGTYHEFYLRFPVLGRWLAHVGAMLCDNGRKLIERLKRDRQAIADGLLGDEILRFRSVKLGRSDCHAGGQTVALVTVDLARGGQGAFVYKPRCLRSQAALQGLLDRLAKDGVIGFGAYRMLDRDGYGYEELLPLGRNRATAADEVAGIYREIGGYLAVFHALGGGDLHFENVLVADGHAYICDAETAVGVLPRGETSAVGTVIDSVYRTGLLEWPLARTAEVAMRMSGASGGESYDMPIAVPKVRQGPAGLAVVHETGVHVETDPANRVWLGGELVSPEDFQDAIVEGFGAVHDWFTGRPTEAIAEITELFERASIRYVSRATQIYAQLLIAARHPKCLREPLEVDLTVSKMREQAQRWDRDSVLTDREVSSLWQLDIPIFGADAGGSVLLADHSAALAVPLELSPVAFAAKRIRALSPENRLRQEQYIAASLSLSEVHSPAFVASALDHVSLIGCRLHEMLDDAADRAPWKSYQITDGGASTIEIQTDLYYGSAGVSLFLAYLDSVAPRAHIRRAAERAIEHALTCHEGQGIGAFEGAAGLIYVLTHLHALWRDPVLLDHAVRLTAVIDEGIECDRTFDVFSGAAGAIPVLIGLADASAGASAEATGDASGAGLDLAHRCARHLIDNAERTPAGLSWAPPRPGEAAANLTGFAHGTAGIGWALITLGARAGRAEYVAAGLEAFRYETSHFDEIEQDWYDLRTNVIAMSPGRRHFSNAWCAGAAGIGLSRLASWAALGRDDEGLLKEAYLSLHATLRNFQGLGNDTLCHGRSGNTELLLRFARLRDEPAFQLEANVQAQAQWRRLAADPAWLGRDGDVPVFPGLMIGLAGIGMHFLRLAHPDKVPSPLLLDPPPAASDPSAASDPPPRQ